MSRGRKPIPLELKKLRGNPGKRQLPETGPTPPAGKVVPPAWLSKEGLTVWRELAPLLSQMRVLTRADPQALALLCDAYVEYVKARRAVRREGTTYESKTPAGGKIVRARPEVAIAADAWRRVRAMLTEFGMTPSSRTKLALPPQEEKDEVEEWQSGKRRPVARGSKG